jgi:hypothetical protein
MKQRCPARQKEASAIHSPPGDSKLQTSARILQWSILHLHQSHPFTHYDAVAATYLKLYPEPNNTANVSAITNQGNDNSNAPNSVNYTTEFGRLDYNLSSRDHIFFDMRHNASVNGGQDYLGNHTTDSNLFRITAVSSALGLVFPTTQAGRPRPQCAAGSGSSFFRNPCRGPPIRLVSAPPHRMRQPATPISPV